MMNTEQYNECLKQANLAIKRLQSKIERLEKENSELTDDLIEAQNQCREAENKLEDIELFFCDEDGCPIIEPLNSDGLESWFKAHNLKLKKNSILEFVDAVKDFGEISGSDTSWINLFACEFNEELPLHNNNIKI